MGDAVPTIADAEAALGRPVSAGERARIIKTAVLTTRPVKEADLPEGDLRARWADQAAGLGWDGPRLRLTLQRERQASDRREPVDPGWRDRVMVGAVTAVGRCKAIWSRADLTVQIAARIPPRSSTSSNSSPTPPSLAPLTGRSRWVRTRPG